MFLSRWRYYVRSIPALFLGVKNWPAMLALFLKLPITTPLLIHLRSRLHFKVRTAMDVWIIKETCLDRDYERVGVPLQAGWTVVDIGAGLGDFTVYASRAVAHGMVYAIEPSPDSLQLLHENVALNGCTNVKAFPYAISSTDQGLSLDVGSGVAVKYHTIGTEATSTDTTVQVQGKTLRVFFMEQTIKRCDFLKMDCEGAEFDILLNVDPAVLQCIQHLCLEYHNGVTPFSHIDLMKHLMDHGFQVRRIPNPAHQTIGFLYATRR